MKTINCPNCGSGLELELEFVKMTCCPFCATTVFLEGDILREAGTAGEMHEYPLLFGLSDHVQLNGSRIQILGHARFSYGRGVWDEFWGLSTHGQSSWVSLDEGDIVLQSTVPQEKRPHKAMPEIGSEIACYGKIYTVVEVETATCIAVRGSFDEPLFVGDTYTFLNAQDNSNSLLSGEFWKDEQAWFVGQWIDPFDVKVMDQNDA
jgi:hypothetical protein